MSDLRRHFLRRTDGDGKPHGVSCRRMDAVNDAAEEWRADPSAAKADDLHGLMYITVAELTSITLSTLHLSIIMALWGQGKGIAILS